MRHVFVLLAALCCSPFLPCAAMADDVQSVDVALVLGIDTSSSVSGERFILQTKGYRSAFLNKKLVTLIQSGLYGMIEVTAFTWSNCASQETTVPWMVITDESSARAVAEQFDQMRRSHFGNTCPAAALAYAGKRFASAPHHALKHVIDLSGDGDSDESYRVAGTVIATSEIRDQLVAQRIVINGLALTTPADSIIASNNTEAIPVVSFYRHNVIGGRLSFLEIVPDAGRLDSFVEALNKKLAHEVIASR